MIKEIFFLGILVLSVLSILGLIYITKLTFTKKKLNKTEEEIVRLTTVLLWLQIGCIVFGSMIITLWGCSSNGLFE